MQLFLTDNFRGTQRTASDLRGVLNQRKNENCTPAPISSVQSQTRNRQRNRRSQHHTQDSGKSTDRSCSSSRSRSRCDGGRSCISKRARELPLPHKQAPKVLDDKGKRVKPSATDLNFDDFFIYSLKTALSSLACQGCSALRWKST